MSEPLVHFVGEQNPSLIYTVTSGGVAVDLSSATAKTFTMRTIDGASVKVNAAGANFVNTGSDGKLRYDWQAADVDTEAFYLGRFTFTIGGKTESTPEFVIWMKGFDALSGAIVTLEEARQSLELREIADELDDRIQQLIPIVSERIQEEVQRELVPTANATRVFTSRGRIFDLAPWDLRAATAVVLDPNDQAITLAVGTDYKLRPSTSRWGTYTRIKLSTYYPQAMTTLAKYEESELSVAGSWGMATVPQIAKEAAFITIRAWLDRTSRHQAYVDSDIQSAIPVGTYALPPAARNMLQPLKRFDVA